MPLFFLFIYIYKLSAFFEYIHKPERISFIVDMSIKKILNKDGSIPDGVLLKEDVAKNEKFKEFIWDKYYPKAIFYFIEFKNALNLTTISKLKFKLLSDGEKEMFNFEIKKNLGNLSNFTSNENDKFNVRKREKAIHEYILGSQEGYYEFVVDIFDSIDFIETVKPHYSNLLRMFNILKQNLRICLNESNQLFENDESICLKIWELNKSVIEISIPFIKSLATLRIPSLNKLEYLESFEGFMAKKDALSKLIKDLKEAISIQLSNYDQNNFGKEDFAIQNNLILVIDEYEDIDKKTINERYNNFMDGLKSISRFFEKIKSKSNNETKIEFNPDDKVVENFIDKYYSLFLEYCDIMGSCDEVYLDEYLYHITLKFGGTYSNVSEEMFFDIVVAKEMRKYLKIYQVDKTDFLIFARTDYFQNKLFDKMLHNLYMVTHSLIIEKKLKGMMYEKMVVLSQKDQELMTRIGNLYDLLDPIFNLVKKTKSLLVCEDESISFTVHQNLLDNKNQIDNDSKKIDNSQVSDEEELAYGEKTMTDRNGDEYNLKDSNKPDEYNPRSHDNLDESQKTGIGQKIESFSSGNCSNRFFDENLICSKKKLDESQISNNEQEKDEIDLSYVQETNNDHQYRDEARQKEKIQESNNLENEQPRKEDLKSKNLFINYETRAEENCKLDCDYKENIRNRLYDEQNKKNEYGLNSGQNFNNKNKLNNETELSEFKPLIHKNKNNNRTDNEIKNSKGYYIFHIILVMFAAISLIGLFIFCVFDKK